MTESLRIPDRRSATLVAPALRRGAGAHAGASAVADPIIGKLTMLSVNGSPPAQIVAALRRLTQLPFVEQVLSLPDLHQKEHMEVPSSLAISTRDVVVPEFTSVAVNDGMGVLVTPLKSSEMSPERLDSLFTRVARHSAAHHLDANRYSLSPSELRRALIEGAPALVGKYGLDPHTPEAMEEGGQARIPCSALTALAEAAPALLLRSPTSRCEMGLNFGGNHFLEVQVVDEVLDAGTARHWGLECDQVIVMYHLGPGPFSSTLLHHYSRREKLQAERVPFLFLAKLLFHYLQRAGRGDFGRKWTLYFRRNGWTPLPASSEEGRLWLLAYSLATNFGFAYRLATIAAVRDGLHEAVSSDLPVRLLCDVSHNGVDELPGATGFLARHNSCRLRPGRPTVVAGSCDVPSYLGVAGHGQSGQIPAYDHGAGNLIDVARRDGRLASAQGAVATFRKTRGRSARTVAREQRPLMSSETIDRLMDCFQQHNVMTPVVRLRPIANLKN